MQASLARRLVAEALGTAILLAAVVGSGIMAERLAGGNVRHRAPVQYAGDRRDPHRADPDVRPDFRRPFQSGRQRRLRAARRAAVAREAGLLIAVQIVGGVLGVWAAHFMFELPLWQFSTTARTGAGQWFAEAVATFGLVLTILGCLAHTKAAVPYAVGLYITAAYWFTASTSFANPAVTIARSLSDTFAGIAPGDVAGVHRGADGGDAGGGGVGEVVVSGVAIGRYLSLRGINLPLRTATLSPARLNLPSRMLSVDF